MKQAEDPGAEVAAWFLFTLMRAAPFMWLVAAGLVIWEQAGGPDEIGPVASGLFVMGATGLICYAIRRFRSDTAGLLLQALLATPPQQPEAAVLHLVEGEATQSASPARQASAD